MKKLVLILTASCLSFMGIGQIAVTGISPATIEGNYNFSLGETTQSWGLTLDFSSPGVHIEGELALVEDGTAGTNPQGNPISQEGCNALINGTDVSGKIAVIYRNTCDFGVKALNAQNAGAIGVIILNRDPEVLGMNGGPSGATVTIPVVMLSSIDGALLTNEMENGPVVMFIGNKAGLNTYDLGLVQDFVAVPTYHGVHSLLAQNGSDYNFNLGLKIFNYGTESEVEAVVNATVVGPTGTVYDESITFDLDGVDNGVIDSIDIFPGEAQTFPLFSLSSYPVGEYTLTYTITNGGGATDLAPSDNTYSTTFVVNDEVFSRARLDATTYMPKANSMTKPAAPTTGSYDEIIYCSSFSHPNASRVGVTGMYASVSTDSVDASSSLEGKFIYVDVYEWNNASVVYDNVMAGVASTYDINPVGSIEYNFSQDQLRVDEFFPFENPIELVDNQMYLFCLVDYGYNLNFGYDREVDYNVTYQLTTQMINPLKVQQSGTATWYAGGFGADLTPAFAIKAIDAASLKVEKLTNLEGSAYPNPASDVITMNIALDGKATVEITDLTGRIVSTSNVDFISNNASLNISELKEGMFIANVMYDNGAKTTFNFIKK